MKQDRSKIRAQLAIYVPLVILVLGIYLIELCTDGNLEKRLSAAAPAISPTPTAVPEEALPSGIPVDTLLASLSKSGLTLTEGKSSDRYLLRDASGSGRMHLVLSMNRDLVTALTLDFPCPEALPRQTRGATPYNALTKAHQEQALQASLSALDGILSALCNAFSDGSLPADTHIRWYDGAAEALRSGDSFQSRDSGFVFRADPALSAEGREILRISISYQ